MSAPIQIPGQTPVPRFNLAARALHCLMALMILSMLFIGIGMVSTVSDLHSRLLDLHRPLGLSILVLALIRLGVRLRYGAPAMPADLPRWQHHAASISHILLYALMLAMPLLGWAMLSAGGYPVTVGAGLVLPPIVPQSRSLYALLRGAHTDLALLFFASFLTHFAAALFHALIRRDGVFRSMRP